MSLGNQPIFLRSAWSRVVMELMNLFSVPRSFSSIGVPPVIVSSSKAKSIHSAVSYAISQSDGFSPRSSFTAAARDCDHVRGYDEGSGD